MTVIVKAGMSPAEAIERVKRGEDVSATIVRKPMGDDRMLHVSRRPIDPESPGMFGSKPLQRCEAKTTDPTTRTRKCSLYAKQTVDGWPLCNRHAEIAIHSMIVEDAE